MLPCIECQKYCRAQFCGMLAVPVLRMLPVLERAHASHRQANVHAGSAGFVVAMGPAENLQVPMVIRGPGGVGRQLGAEHSQRLESYFQSIPGVQLVACSTATNAKALLKSAIRSDNPVIFFEHVLLYNVKGERLSVCTSAHGAVLRMCQAALHTAFAQALYVVNELSKQAAPHCHGFARQPGAGPVWALHQDQSSQSVIRQPDAG